MAVVTKVIKGHQYYYYQDTIRRQPKVKIKDNSDLVRTQIKVVTTLIGRTDLDNKELLKRREEALKKHFIKVFKATSRIKKVNYKFENKPTTVDIDTLEMIRVMYKQFMDSLLPHERESFKNTFFIKYVYGTTAIEGNTLTEEEAGKLLSAGLTSNNKPYNETVEVANYNDLRGFMETYPNHEDVTEKLIKHIHKLLMKGVMGLDGRPINAGEYRTTNATITGVWHKPIDPDLINERIHYVLTEYYEGQRNSIHPIELASIFHQKFEEIHPFTEGNGRTGREILNFMLKKNGFPPIYITPRQRSEYLNALEEGNKSNYVPLIDFIIKRMHATLAYLLTKTNIFKTIKSDQYKNLFRIVGDETVYNKYIKKMEYLNKSEELP